MLPFRSFRSRLQAAFVASGLAVLLIADWVASQDATRALQQATYERLTAIRETKRRQIEDYFRDLQSHVLALSIDEASISALEEFRDSWDTIPAVTPDSPAGQRLRQYYRNVFAPTVKHDIATQTLMERWYPADTRTILLQDWFLASNTHPIGSKDLLLVPDTPSRYGQAHRRYHPTLHRYQTSFGLYDVFLIDASGRVLYTVFKEIDLGVGLNRPPYEQTALARVFRSAMTAPNPENVAIEDYRAYIASHFRPAAFAAVPVTRAGARIGVLAVQVSIDDVNRVMTGGRNWAGEGLGQSGQAYLVGSDGKLRSDARFELERPQEYLAQLRNAGVTEDTVNRIQRNGTTVLNLEVSSEVRALLNQRKPGTQIGYSNRGQPLLRSHAPLALPALEWSVIAEIEVNEAFAPVSRLRRRIWSIGLLIAVLYFAAAWWMARSMTRPLHALAESARRLGGRDFSVRLPIESADEVGQLAASFNSMTEQLQSTTVSKDELDRANQELRHNEERLRELAARLVAVQEEERSRLARELHDDITQRVAALAIQAGQWKRNPEVDHLKNALDRLQHQLGVLSGDIHGLSRRLHSSVLEERGLAESIESECRSFFDRGGPPVSIRIDGDFDALHPDSALTLYRVVQESLRNIEKHAAASEVSIALRRSGGEVELEIHDNGIGFDATSARGGLGLSNIRERARLVGGSTRVTSALQSGTTVSVVVPWKEHHDETSNPAG